MTAPGQHLEFSGSPEFRKRVQAWPGLAAAVQQQLAADPELGVVHAGQIRTARIQIQGVELALLFRRSSNRIGLMAIYHLPQEEHHFRTRLNDLIRLFGSHGKERL